MSDYRLINCEFHDRLEAWSTLRQPCQIVYQNAVGELVTVGDRIVDVYAANREEFLKLSDGTVIRLDKLISVNDEPISFATD